MEIPYLLMRVPEFTSVCEWYLGLWWGGARYAAMIFSF
jgi:hypothetical protein